MSPQQLRVNILATRDELVHMDTFDLCKAKSRTSFIKATAAELFIDEATIKKDIGQLLLQLEQLREQQIDSATAPTTKIELTAAEKTSRDEVPERSTVDRSHPARLRRLRSGRRKNE